MKFVIRHFVNGQFIFTTDFDAEDMTAAEAMLAKSSAQVIEVARDTVPAPKKGQTFVEELANMCGISPSELEHTIDNGFVPLSGDVALVTDEDLEKMKNAPPKPGYLDNARVEVASRSTTPVPGSQVVHVAPDKPLNDIILTLLHSQLYITDNQLQETMAKASAESIHPIDALKQLYGISDEEVTMMVASIYGMETFDFTGVELPQKVIDSGDCRLCRKWCIMPVAVNDDIKTLVIHDPSDLNLLDCINRVWGPVDILVSTKKQIEEALNKYYPVLDMPIDQECLDTRK